jgi:hypothetical protein
MPDRAYIVARRNDLDGVNMQVTDLRPNTSQRNLIYDGPGQSGYLKYSYDQPGVTVVQGDSYASGPMTTAPLLVLAAADTTGGGNDVEATTRADFGLTAYLRERIEAGGLAAGTVPPTPAEALAMANGLAALIEAGTALTLVTINAALSVVVAATELTTAGGSESFGAVEDILRLLQGQAYRVRGLTIVNSVAGAFQSPAQRQTFVDNQDTIATGLVFFAGGEFLAEGDSGFRHLRNLTPSGAMRISLHEGVLSGFADAAFGYFNPNFAYAAGTTMTRAVDIGGTAVPATGVHPAIAVFNPDGSILVP